MNQFIQKFVESLTRDPVVQFVIMLVTALLENPWLVLRCAVVARPRLGGRDLPEEFTLKTFCNPYSRYHYLNRFSPRFFEFKIPLRASETSGYDSTNVWVKDRPEDAGILLEILQYSRYDIYSTFDESHFS